MKKKIISFLILIFFTNFQALAKNNHKLVLGEENTNVTIKVFSSLTCSHCARFHLSVFDSLNENYIQNGKVRFEHYAFPLDLAALSAEKMLRCKNDSKKFQLLREIYSKQSTWTKGNDINTINNALKKIGIKFGLTSQEMTNCFNNDKLTNIVLEERINAQKKFNIESTPTIFINDKKYKGSHKFSELEKEIKKKLK